MADRLSQYSMSHNFGPGAVGMMNHHQLNPMQQQQQQQPGQQQQDSSQQAHPGMSGFNDQNRVWSQMQQMQQIRPQNGQDMTAPSTQQMTDLLRSQRLAQMHSQQQRFLGLNGSGPNQQFMDQPNQTQHNMSMGLNSMGQHNPSYQQSMHNRQTMLQALQENQPYSRQLELMGLARNQENQNGPVTLGNRGAPMNGPPQGLNPLQSQNDMFPTPNGMRRPSPHPSMQPPLLNNAPSNLNGNPQNSRGTVMVGGRPINLGDLTERATALRTIIQNSSIQLHQMQQRPNVNDPMFMTRMRTLQAELAGKKESLNKIVTLMNICVQQNNGGNGTLNGTGGPSQLPLPPSNGGQPWQSSPFGNATQPSNMPGSQTQPAGPGPRSSPAPPHPSSGLPVNAPNNVPPRSSSTPQQQLNPFAMRQYNFPINDSSTNGASGPSNLGPTMPIFNTPIPPLDKQRFDATYKQWCQSKHILHDPRILTFENRPIDLYLLHCLVIREGGTANVTRNDLWPVIGGQLGIINFPGEPPRSGPGAAMHIQNVYKEYLMAFDSVYTTSVMNSRRKAQGAAVAASFPEPLRNLTDGQLRMFISCADKPSAELRARGMSETMISFIENHRSTLQNMSTDPEHFINDIRRAQPPQGPMPGNVGHGGHTSQPFPNAGNITQPFMRPPGEPQHPPPLGRPSPEQLKIAHMTIQRTKDEIRSRVLPSMSMVDVPLENRTEYNTMLDFAFRLATELDHKLAVYSLMSKSEEHTKKLLTAIVSVQHQRGQLAPPNPKYIITFETLRIFTTQLQTAVQHISKLFQQLFRGDPAPPGGVMNDQSQIYSGPAGRAMPPGQPPANLPHPPVPNIPNQLNQPNQPNPNLSARPLNSPPSMMKNKKPSGAPTPPAAAATPVASASTPATAAAASPQTPKSPKTKAVPKKPKPRKTSTPKVNATPTLDHATIPTTSTAGVKRPREEDSEVPQPNPGPSTGSNPLPSVSHEPSPPKRVKTEWDGPVSEALQKRNQAVENIKTEEDASQFLEHVTQLIKNAGPEEQAALTSDISETLEQLLKGYDGGPLLDSDSSNTFSTLGLTEVGSLDATASTSQIPSSNDFAEFFDFSLFSNEDEGESKAGTPDLVSSSSTNTSPESQADADPAHHATALLDHKQEEYDPLRLGTLKEIDGGESAYYQSTEWKWDEPMPTLEQPWAIFNS
ncbi:hypothetical protein C8R42DRAFT_679661 [Lentinula raphanica]|nr:hypothetical protein C8R42DRAFT_679661 [Lentinula raphanica]